MAQPEKEQPVHALGKVAASLPGFLRVLLTLCSSPLISACPAPPSPSPAPPWVHVEHGPLSVE